MRKLVFVLFIFLTFQGIASAKNIKFSAEQTFTEEQVLGFAKYIGWTEKITNPDYFICNFPGSGIEPCIEKIDNPVSASDYVKEKFIEHSKMFTTQWAQYLVEETAEVARKQAEEQAKPQILDPIANGFTMTVSEEA